MVSLCNYCCRTFQTITAGDGAGTQLVQVRKLIGISPGNRIFLTDYSNNAEETSEVPVLKKSDSDHDVLRSLKQKTSTSTAS